MTIDPSDNLGDITNGTKLVVNMYNAGLMSSDNREIKRQHVQAWREKLSEQQGYHRWQFISNRDGYFAIKHVPPPPPPPADPNKPPPPDHYVEPVRKEGDKGSYDTPQWGTWVWLEAGTPPGARQLWSIRQYGELYMFVLKDTRLAMGIRDLDNRNDSHVDLYDDLYTARNLWHITDAR